MSMLSDRDILQAVENRQISIHPVAPRAMQPCSVDIRLDARFLMFGGPDNLPIDPKVSESMLTIDVEPGDAFQLAPGAFALGSTVERLTLPDNIAGRLEGKSSIGRLGIEVHSTAGFIDPGFDGYVTLELKNVAPRPVLLWPGMFIGQVAFFDLTSRSQSPYGSKTLGSHYQGQEGPQASRAYLQFERQRHLTPVRH